MKLYSGLVGLALGVTALAAQLQRVNYQTSARTRPEMWIYVPDRVETNPALVVVIHSCQSTAQSYSQNSLIPWRGGSDRKGYITLWPSSPHSGTCWDVSSRQTLMHDGGGDSQAISDMITHALQQYGADPEKVFVTGGSSGAMMANVMAATYPERIKAVSLYSGVPAGCFVSTSGGVDQWNNTCSGGQSRGTPESWGTVVRNMYPGYEGPRPKMQIWHGSIDTTLNSANYLETLKQWTNVFEVDMTPTETRMDYPQMNYRTDDFGPNVQGIWARGVGHSVPANLTASEEWFGL